MKKYQELKQELLQDPAVSRAFDELESEYQLAESLVKARLAKKMTQAELARKTGLKQAMIARLESGTANPTIATVSKVATVLGKRVKLVGIAR